MILEHTSFFQSIGVKTIYQKAIKAVKSNHKIAEGKNSPHYVFLILEIACNIFSRRNFLKFPFSNYALIHVIRSQRKLLLRFPMEYERLPSFILVFNKRLDIDWVIEDHRRIIEKKF